MTQHKDLKRRIRERMTKTGESYTAARAHVIGERAAPPRTTIPVVEPRHVIEEAVALGLRCNVLATEGFDAGRALRQLHDILATTDDADLDVMRAAVLRGERPRWKSGGGPAPRIGMEDVRKFLVRAKAGVGGVGPHGWLVAYVCDGAMLLAALSLMRDGSLTVWLRRIETAASDELALAAITLR